MIDDIEVWDSKIKIPQLVLEKISLLKPKKLRDKAGLECIIINGLDAFLTDGICDWHDDMHIDAQYSLLLVVRNDTNSYVQSEAIVPVKNQPVGTMIELNIWKNHRLWNENGDDTELGVFAVLCTDLINHLSKEKCELYFERIIKERFKE